MFHLFIRYMHTNILLIQTISFVGMVKSGKRERGTLTSILKLSVELRATLPCIYGPNYLRKLYVDVIPGTCKTSTTSFPIITINK